MSQSGVDLFTENGLDLFTDNGLEFFTEKRPNPIDVWYSHENNKKDAGLGNKHKVFVFQIVRWLKCP